MRYSDVETFVSAALVDLGYALDDPTSPVLNPGPPTTPELLKLSPNRLVFLFLGNGAGLTTEGLYDRVFLSVRTIGRQEDFTDAENLAYQLDNILLTATEAGPIVMGTARVLYVTRTGGAPALLEKDAADRYHFSCSYLIETKTG